MPIQDISSKLDAYSAGDKPPFLTKIRVMEVKSPFFRQSWNNPDKLPADLVYVNRLMGILASGLSM